MKNYNPRILLIYNKERDATEIDNYLKKFNFRNIVGTDDVLTAVKFCEINKVDIILSNLEMNNYCVVKRLLEKRVLTGIPLIFYTFKADDFKKYSPMRELTDNDHVRVLFDPTVDTAFYNSIIKLYQLKISDKFRNCLFAKSKLGQLEKINFADIKFVESDVAHCKIHTKWGVYKTSGSLANLLKNLNKSFVKVHEKYIVNITHISNFSSSEVVIDGIRIPSSKINQTSVKAKLQSVKGDKEIKLKRRELINHLSDHIVSVPVS